MTFWSYHSNNSDVTFILFDPFPFSNYCVTGKLMTHPWTSFFTLEVLLWSSLEIFSSAMMFNTLYHDILHMLVVHHLLCIILLLNHALLLISIAPPPNICLLDHVPEHTSAFLPQPKFNHWSLHLQAQFDLWMKVPQPSFLCQQNMLHWHHCWTRYLKMLKFLIPWHHL